jgi:hypothetical protein
MRAFFDERVTAEKLHIGRWRHEVPPERLARFDAHHDRLARELQRRGRPYAPADSPDAVAARRDEVLV